jgi:hypothetical protein
MGAALAATVADADVRATIFQAMTSLADHIRNRPADEERGLPAG